MEGILGVVPVAERPAPRAVGLLADPWEADPPAEHPADHGVAFRAESYPEDPEVAFLEAPCPADHEAAFLEALCPADHEAACQVEHLGIHEVAYLEAPFLGEPCPEERLWAPFLAVDHAVDLGPEGSLEVVLYLVESQVELQEGLQVELQEVVHGQVELLGVVHGQVEPPEVGHDLEVLLVVDRDQEVLQRGVHALVGLLAAALGLEELLRKCIVGVSFQHSLALVAGREPADNPAAVLVEVREVADPDCSTTNTGNKDEITVIVGEWLGSLPLEVNATYGGGASLMMTDAFFAQSHRSSCCS
ncbi:hypothetical protein BBJ28_00002288 [Nothophytophthora sp. Chile5]|nr:hypothetical protein BBJ28_00002288 [Nothophytophthora sp. Chile5]